MSQDQFSPILSRSLNVEKLSGNLLFEGVLVALILGVSIALNIVTSMAFHAPWVDEVLIADPAVNLYLGKGFTSSAWYYQTKEAFWACNAPLHQIILFHWIKIFGVNPISVRSINFVLTALFVLLIWWAVYRLKLVTSIQARLALVALLLCGAGVTFSYTSGRYDCIGITLLAAAFFSYSIPALWIRALTLLCLGVFIPIAGIHLIPYVIILAGLLLFYLRGKFIKEAISLSIGTVLGGLFLYVLYLTNGVEKVLLTSAGGHGLASAVSSLDSSNAESFRNAELGGKVVFVLTHLPQILIARFMNLPGWFLSDHSFVFLLILLVGFVAYSYRRKSFQFRSIPSFGLAAALTIPLILGALRDYPFYYSWMAYIPLAICTVSAFSNELSRGRFTITRLVVIALLFGACWVGYPTRLVASIQSGAWQRDYSRLEAFINTNIQPGERVYSDFEAYYPLKRIADYALFPTYKDVLSPQERQEVTALILKPIDDRGASYQDTLTLFGGKWRETARMSESDPYNLRIYRRG